MIILFISSSSDIKIPDSAIEGGKSAKEEKKIEPVKDPPKVDCKFKTARYSHLAMNSSTLNEITDYWRSQELL